jgi:EAL domain-containing protein (putative c-di-GMP-specific phosphodiesterase class I)
VRAATGLAKALGMVSAAEGVEREDQMASVRIEGCSEAQGFLISRPMPAGEVLRFLGGEPRLAATTEGSESERPAWPPVLVPTSRVSA